MTKAIQLKIGTLVPSVNNIKVSIEFCFNAKLSNKLLTILSIIASSFKQLWFNEFLERLYMLVNLKHLRLPYIM